MIDDPKLKAEIAKLVDQAVEATNFARSWRDRRIAHRDLKLALEQPTTPLAEGSRADVKKALKALAAVLNALAAYYLDGQTGFEHGAPLGGASSLLHTLEVGTKEREAELKRLEETIRANDDLAAKASHRRTMTLGVVAVISGFGLWLLTPVIWLFTVYLGYLASFPALLCALLLPFISQLYWVWALWNETGTSLNLFTALCIAWVALAVVGLVARAKLEMT